MPELLKLSGVSAGYGPTVVLEGIALALAERSSLAVLGRNGVGKTTLLGTIMGHTTLHGGSLEFRGQSVARLPVYERAKLGMGFVPQGRWIFPSLTVEENLTVAERPGPWTLGRVYELFPRLAERRGNMGNQISGGEQQMLAIARALMGLPRVLMLDEPSLGLAPQVIEDLFQVLRRLRDEGMTLVVVDQMAALALALADDAYICESGCIVAHGASRQIAADPALANAYLGAH